MSVKRAN